jgi:hypothetical protein
MSTSGWPRDLFGRYVSDTDEILPPHNTPEQASKMYTVAASTIRMLARKVASKRTTIVGSLGNASKYYHGDLIETI